MVSHFVVALIIWALSGNQVWLADTGKGIAIRARNNIYMSLNLSIVKGIYRVKSLFAFDLAASEAWLNCFYSIII